MDEPCLYVPFKTSVEPPSIGFEFTLSVYEGQPLNSVDPASNGYSSISSITLSLSESKGSLLHEKKIIIKKKYFISHTCFILV